MRLITGMAMSRRTFLKGAGASISPPLPGCDGAGRREGGDPGRADPVGRHRDGPRSCGGAASSAAPRTTGLLQTRAATSICRPPPFSHWSPTVTT